jgi:hypothetical protein
MARRSCGIVASSRDGSQGRQAIAAKRCDEIGGKGGVSLEPLVERSAGLEISEELVQGPWAESVDPAREAGEAFAGRSRG